MDTSRPRVGIYARISEDKDGTQTATSRQMEDARQMAERKDWDVVDIFEDVDISAYKVSAKRPEFERMILAIRDQEIDGIVVWKLDRLTRQQKDLSRVLEACRPHNAFVASVTEPIDTRDNYGQLIAEILIAQARAESANTSVRQKRKALEQAKLGIPPAGGSRCFGYERGYTKIIPEEAAVIRESRDRMFAGESLRSICFDLESRGVVGTRGVPWRAHILARLLASPTIAGIRELQGSRHPGTWEAIISEADNQRLRAMFHKRPGSRKEAPARKYLLTGFLRCGTCGGRLSAHMRANYTGQYVCKSAPGYPNCGGVSVKSEPLETLVAEMVFAAVDDVALAQALAERGEQDDGLNESIRRDEAQLEMLSRDFYVDQLLSREEFTVARTELTKRLEANRLVLSKRDRRGVVGAFVGSSSALRAAWETRSLDWRRSIVGALLERVEIMPTAVKGRQPFDVGRVKPIWRF